MPYKNPKVRREKQREYQRRYQAKRPDYYRDKARQQAERITSWLDELREGAACIECGEDHPACIVFHHRDPEQKLFNIADARDVGPSKKRLLAEVAKCDVLCSNCHRKLHWELMRR